MSGYALNAAQRKAVEHGEGPLLVIAGAGTGKTRVIIERIGRLLETQPELQGGNILALTFTDKAAGEMLARVRLSLGKRAEGVWLSTFHGFCLKKILGESSSGMRLLDNEHHWILLRRHIAQLKLDCYRKIAEPGQFLSDFVSFFSRCQDELVTPGDYQEYVNKLRASFAAGKDGLDPPERAEEELKLKQQEEVARVYRASEELLRSENCLTFGALILRAVQRLRSDAELLRRMQEQYHYILVDEFQDTNIAQIELLWLLAGGHRNIVAVGDDDQAIYRFRGASFGSFTIFLNKFGKGQGMARIAAISAAAQGATAVAASAASAQATVDQGVRADGASSAADSHPPVLALSENYRSSGRILRVARQVMEQNERAAALPAKHLVTHNTRGERIRIAEFRTAQEEAFWIAGELERLHGQGEEWRNFAVLYRKHNSRNALVEALRQKQIPFIIRKLSILSSTLIRDVLAYLRLIDAPGDNVSCARVLGVPYWGFSPCELVRLAERAGQKKEQSLLEMLVKQPERPLGGNGHRGTELAELLADLRARAREASASELFAKLIDRLGARPLESEADQLNLERLGKFIEDWEKNWASEGQANRLRDFLEYFEYFLEAGGEICLEQEREENAVELMTAHAAKGLEFPQVFIIELVEGDFPARAQPAVLEFPPELMKEERPRGDHRIQEERRLFYVALTRAQRQLTLSTVLNRRRKASPFLEDILSAPEIQKNDTQQMQPQVALPEAEETVGPVSADSAQPLLFGRESPCSRVFSRIALWAKSYFPPQREPLPLSATSIDVYESCPAKYLFQYMWRIRGGPLGVLTFGNVMHTTIREAIAGMRKGQRISTAEAQRIYEREWSPAGFRDAYQENEYRQEGRQQLEAFFQSYRTAPTAVLYQEKKFELALDPNVTVTGRMDQINRLGEGEVEIIDYKTGNPRKAKDAEKSLQLSLYALAAREVLELQPARLVFYNLSSNEAVSTTRSEKDLAKARAKVAEVAEQIRARDFSARPGYACRNCEYRALCPAHEQLVSLPSR